MADQEQAQKKKPKKERSYKAKIIIWTIVLLVIDEVTIGVPEADLLLIFVVLFRPQWFLNMMHRLYKYVPHKRAWRPVGEVCRREVVTISSDTMVADAARLMRDRHERGLLVVEEREYFPSLERDKRKKKKWWGRRSKKKSIESPPPEAETIIVPVGILIDRDIILRIGAEDLSGATIPVAEVMTTELEVTLESEDVHSAVEKMREAGMRRLPVVDHRGSLMGILSLDDTIAMLSDGLNDMSSLLQREMQKEVAVETQGAG